MVKLRGGGRSAFADFYAATKDDWRRMACKLFNRWRLPSGVTEDDVEQEMLLAAWKAAMLPPERGGWDESRGVTLAVHVVWCAHAATKKWIHTQRKAKRRCDHAPSRHPIAASALLLRADAEDLGLSSIIDTIAQCEGGQEESADARAVLECLKQEYPSTFRGKAALEAWLTACGDLEEAARSWWGDSFMRHRDALDDEGHAALLIRRELAKLRRRFEVAEEDGS